VYVNAAESVACAFAPAGAPAGAACRITRQTCCPAVSASGPATAVSPPSITPLQFVSRTRSIVQPGTEATCEDPKSTEPAEPAMN